MTPLPRRDLLLGALWAMLLAVFPWLRRKREPERYLYQLTSFDCDTVRLYPSIRQEFTLSTPVRGSGTLDGPVGPPTWRFHDYRIEWKVDPNAIRARMPPRLT